MTEKDRDIFQNELYDVSKSVYREVQIRKLESEKLKKKPSSQTELTDDEKVQIQKDYDRDEAERAEKVKDRKADLERMIEELAARSKEEKMALEKRLKTEVEQRTKLEEEQKWLERQLLELEEKHNKSPFGKCIIL